jgi:hypothetical protein
MSWQEINSRRTVKDKDSKCRTCVPPERHVGCREACQFWSEHETEKDARNAQRLIDNQTRNDGIEHREDSPSKSIRKKAL